MAQAVALAALTADRVVWIQSLRGNAQSDAQRLTL